MKVSNQPKSAEADVFVSKLANLLADRFGPIDGESPGIDLEDARYLARKWAPGLLELMPVSLGAGREVLP